MKCGSCGGNHKYSFEARDCANRKSARTNREAAQYRNTPNSERKPTANQLSYIEGLAKKKGIKGVKTPVSFSAASRMIDYLKGQPDVKNPERPGPVISYMVTNMIKDGRYAVRTTEEDAQYVFIRVSRPTRGHNRGTLLIQSQHSEGYVKRLQFNTQGDTLYQNNRLLAGQRLADVISMIVVDQNRAALNYGTEKGICCRCGKQLTDRRSAHYGVGPECVKYMPGYIEWVDDQKGAFK